jgi:hypothetical protein
MTLSLASGFMRRFLPFALAFAAGYSGSAIHDWANRDRRQTVRAGRFELLDPAGNTIAVWTPNRRSQDGGDLGAKLVFDNGRGDERLVLGTHSGNSTPFLQFYGRDSIERVGVSLGYDDDPLISMSDRQKVRVALGSKHGDAPGPGDDQWGLTLQGRKEGVSANIGFVRWWDGHYQSGISLDGGEGPKWEAVAGGRMNPVPLGKRR